MRTLENLARRAMIVVVVGMVAFFGAQGLKDYDVTVPSSLDELSTISSLDDVVTPKAAAVPSPTQVITTVTTAPAPVAVAPANPTDYSFMAGTPSDPARFDPCTPIAYVVNPGAAPGSLEDAQEAFRRLGAATGLEFVYGGASTQVPTSAWGKDVTNPILVAWADPSQSDLLDPAASANGGGDRVGTEYKTGSVILNINHDNLYIPGFGAGQTRGNLLLHELAHVVGLDHAHDPGQVMYGSISPVSPDGYSSGDLAGLTKLGSAAGCR